ncbi:MAG TPA: sucrose phosphorylase [Streptosporangiaceae bacterium]|nr:sucrose phosphorylase [Streptosporangiaceae bacterium]
MAASVELIAYASRLGGDLARLREILAGPLAGLFAGVHVLPFYLPFDGADAGFDPQDHTMVDPRLGSWDDITALARDGYAVMADLIVNHVSCTSPQFADWLAQGPQSAYDGMFLTFGSVFPRGAREEDLLCLYRPRPGLPFTAYTLADGSKRLVWTTFTPQQTDIDVGQQSTREYLLGVLDRFAAAGVSQVRLDAVGYAVKTPGSSCFMTPETFRFIGEITSWCRQRGLRVLVEVHSYYRDQIEIARQVDQVYDFALPPLVLHVLTTGDPEPLLAWMKVRPGNAVTVLDTHDGIGIIDVGADGNDRSRPGLLTPAQTDQLVATIHDNSGGTSRLATGSAASNVDLYQLNCTFYDALGADDHRYLLARALQFWVPGTPQVYYAGLLAGRNDMELLRQTGVGRDVNRGYYTAAAVNDELRRPVVQALLGLIRFRNAHPAFDGVFDISASGPYLQAAWTNGDQVARLIARLDSGEGLLQWTTRTGDRQAALTELAHHTG